MPKEAMKMIIEYIVKMVKDIGAKGIERIEVVVFGEKSLNIKYTGNIENFSLLLTNYAKASPFEMTDFS